jgi:hypothetical protein
MSVWRIVISLLVPMLAGCGSARRQPAGLEPVFRFTGAQAIRVHRTAAGVVTAVKFDYPQTADFKRVLAEYTRRLRPPGRHDRARDAESAE